MPAWVFEVGIAVVVGVLLNFQLHIVGHRIPDEYFDSLALGHFVRSMIWAGLTPVIFALYRVYPLIGPEIAPRVVLHFVFSASAMLVVFVLRQVHLFLIEEYNWEGLGDAIRHRWTIYHLIDIGTYWAILGIAHMFALWRRSRDLALREAELREQLAETELHVLRQQLQPHFLFNALSAIANMVREGSGQRAVNSIVELSALLRAVMDSAKTPVVKLSSELEFNRRYLAIESARFGEKLSVRLEIEPETESMEVPSMLLHPIVENGIKHGISRRRSPGELCVSSRIEGDDLVLSVENDGPERTGTDTDARTGLGLSTTRSRLEKIYGARAVLALRQENGKTTVTVRIPAVARA